MKVSHMCLRKKESASLFELAIIIVSYNTCDITLQCIQSIIKETIKSKFKIYVVDNKSEDRSVYFIRKKYKDVSLIEMTENIGFSRANNMAADQASEEELLLLLNPDTVVLDAAIDRLLEFSRQHPEAGIWGGRTVFADGSLNPTSCWRHMTLWSLFCQTVGLNSIFSSIDFLNPEAYGGWQRDEVRSVEIVSGCFFLIRKRLWDRLGGFDPDYFMYAEEADLCFRARKLGFQPIFTPDATIIHYGGASEKIRSDKIIKLFAGKMTFVWRHWSFSRAYLALWLFFASVQLRMRGYYFAYKIFGRQEYNKAAQEWRQVWRRRNEWRDGWPRAGSRPS